jgi:hypothetical protein
MDAVEAHFKILRQHFAGCAVDNQENLIIIADIPVDNQKWDLIKLNYSTNTQQDAFPKNYEHLSGKSTPKSQSLAFCRAK